MSEENEKTSLLGEKSLVRDYSFEAAYHRSSPENEDDDEEVLEWGKELSQHEIESFTYSWEGVNVWVQAHRENSKRLEESKQILNNVCGEARGGELTGILGSSGCGKTTLLNLLTFQNIKGLRVEGQRLLNGVSVSSQQLTALSAYIQQVDLFIGTLTVEEHLIFASRLKLPQGLSMKERLARVNHVMQELGLTKCRNTLIGITGRISGISGGEKKRLAFASEVLTNPLLLFCDEPTSGLDSYTAHMLVKGLKEMANTGKAILCTIHQPSSEIFEIFDKIILMAEGHVAFHGTRDQAIEFFNSQGFYCPLTFNPADYFVEVLSILPGHELDTRIRIEQICDEFESSETGRSLKHGPSTTATAEFDLMEKFLRTQKTYRASWLTQFRAVLWRSHLTLIKEPMLIKMRIYQTIVVSLLFGILYFGQERNQDGVMNITGLLFILLTSTTFQNVFAVVNVFTPELPVFLREHFSGMYRTEVYFLSKTFAELPLQMIYPIVFVSIFYFIIGLNSEIVRFLNAVLTILLISNVTCSFGYMISCLSPSLTLTMALIPPTILPLLIFGGFFLNKRSIPPFLAWLRHVSWFLYGFEALSINQWDGVEKIECNRSNTTCLENGAAVLDLLHFVPTNFRFDLLSLVALFFTFRLIAYLGLVRKTRMC